MSAGRSQALLEAAALGAVLLTANRRLARQLRQEYDSWMAQSGAMAWHAPEIHSLDLWLRRCHAVARDGERHLEPLAADYLWEEAIAADLEGGELLNRAELARQAAEAHQLLVEYDADPRGLPLTADQEAFLRWRESYRQRLASGGWLDGARLPQLVCAALREGTLPLPVAVQFVGFDSLPPRALNLAQTLRQLGTQVCEVAPCTEPKGAVLHFPARDHEEEIRSSARWVRRLLEQGDSGIGIIVPNLPDCRREIERIFREELDPASLPMLDANETRFSLSTGTSLLEAPPVRAALTFLGLGARVDCEEASFLLRSPFLAGAERERGARARFDRQLREAAAEFSLTQLLRRAGKSGVPLFHALLRPLADFAHERGRHTPARWAERFAALLHKIGWPGERALHSSEYQACRAFDEKLLGGLASLEGVANPLSRGEAMALLQRLAADCEFQPEGEDGPVQIVGLLEAGGLSFAHLWVMGLTGDVLPAAIRPNPLIPLRLQVDRGMPHVSPERELAYAMRVSARLLAAAPEVIVSCPQQESDMPLTPSPLLAGLTVGTPLLAASHSPQQCMVATPSALEVGTDAQGVPLPAHSRLRGGVAVLKDQALCPFRAYARHRLDAAALPEPQVGPDAAERGSLVHQALERFWRMTESHAALQALGAHGIRERVAECVSAALGGGEEGKATGLTGVAGAIEQERLCRLLVEWLEDVELRRPPFDVKDLEAARELHLGGIELCARIDRIDSLPGGDELLIDYKTGALPKLEELCGERLIEAQLPAYLLAARDAPQARGVAWAGVKLGKCRLLGYAAGGGGGEGVVAAPPGDWDLQTTRWTSQLEELAAAVASGAAAVAPVTRARSCRYCDLARLCRIDDVQPDVEGPD